MKIKSAWPLVMFVLGGFALGSCASSSQGDGSGGAKSQGSGGSTGTGGTKGSGGVSASGGAPGSGGVTATGGASTGGASSGGSPGSGGATGSGGAATGGAATGGATGSGGAANGGAGAGGGMAAGNPAVCSFASGLNVAWAQFAGDVPNPNLTTFNMLFKNTHDAGGRVVRWWFHTNGSVTPGYDASGMTVKIPQSHIDGVKAILNSAATNGVAIDLSLWSFDMLQDDTKGETGVPYANNQKLLEVDANRQAYIDNYLTPLVKALKGTPGLYSYEIFNEPEGMSPTGWAAHRTTQASINRTVNWLAAAIRDSDPTALVTNGSQTFDYCSNVKGKTNNYSDASLMAAGGKQNGTIDFYEVHYYTINGASVSPFKNPATYWGLDKKLVMGEFYALDTDGVAAADLYTYLYTNGYNGAWSWQYLTDDMAGTSTKWPTMKTPIQNVYNAHQQEVGSCP